MADDAINRSAGVFELPKVDNATDTRDLLAHAAKDAHALKDTFVVDVDAHLSEFAFWGEIVDRIDNDVYRQMAQSFRNRPGSPPGLMNATPGMLYQDMFGRIPHQQRLAEKTDGPHSMVSLVQRAMDTMGIDYMVVLPTPMLVLGMHPQAEIEAALGGAFNKWMVEDMLPHEKRMKNFIYLPFNDPPAAVKEVEKYANNPGVLGLHGDVDALQARSSRRLHEALRGDRSLGQAHHVPLGLSLGRRVDEAVQPLPLDARDFVRLLQHDPPDELGDQRHPGTLPKLKTIWIESGLAWVPFMMQRLDSEYMMRTSEAPLLKRKPSEYIREMYFTTQPMERDNLKLLEATFDAINAETQLLYASDWPHWDFDLPNSVTQLPFINEQQKRNILGLNAAKLFNLEVPAHKLGVPKPGPAALAAQGLAPAAE